MNKLPPGEGERMDEGPGARLLRGSHILWASLVATALACNFIVLKVALRSVGPISIQAVGSLCGFVAMLGVCAIRRVAFIPDRKELTFAASVALLFSVLAGVGTTAGLARVNALTAALIGASTPVVTAVLIWALHRRRLETATRLAVAIGFVGVVLVAVGQPRQGSTTILGIVFLTVAVVGWSLTLIMASSASSQMNLLLVAGWQAGIAAPILLMLALVTGEATTGWSINAFLASLYSGVVANVGSLFFQLQMVRRSSAIQTSTIAYVVPVVAWIMAVVVLDEQPTFLQYLGGLGVLVSLRLLWWSRGQRARESP